MFPWLSLTFPPGSLPSSVIRIANRLPAATFHVVTHVFTPAQTVEFTNAFGGMVNGIELLAAPPAVTTRLPDTAPCGTVATMLVAVQLVTVAARPPNLTVPAPWLEPKLVPASVISVPIGADVGVMLLICGRTAE